MLLFRIMLRNTNLSDHRETIQCVLIIIPNKILPDL